MAHLNSVYIAATFSAWFLVVHLSVLSQPKLAHGRYKSCPAGYEPRCIPIHPIFANMYGRKDKFTFSELNKVVNMEMTLQQECYSKGCSLRSDGKCVRTTACHKDGPGTCKERGCDYNLSCWGKCDPETLRGDSSHLRRCPRLCYNIAATARCYIHKPCV